MSNKTETNQPIKSKVTWQTVVIIIFICLLPFGLPALLIYLLLRWIVRAMVSAGHPAPIDAAPTQHTKRHRGIVSSFFRFVITIAVIGALGVGVWLFYTYQKEHGGTFNLTKEAP